MIYTTGVVEIVVCVLCDTPIETEVMYCTANKRYFNHGAASARPLHKGLCCKTCDEEKVLQERIARAMLGFPMRKVDGLQIRTVE